MSLAGKSLRSRRIRSAALGSSLSAPLGSSRLPLGYLSANSRLTLGSCRRTEVVPDALLVAEARPAVRRGLGEEGVVGAPYVDGGVVAAAAAAVGGGGGRLAPRGATKSGLPDTES